MLQAEGAGAPRAGWDPWSGKDSVTSTFSAEDRLSAPTLCAEGAERLQAAWYGLPPSCTREAEESQHR